MSKYSKWMPETKWLVMVGTGGTTALVIWLLHQFGYEMPIEAAEGLVALLTLIIGYLVPERSEAVLHKLADRMSMDLLDKRPNRGG